MAQQKQPLRQQQPLAIIGQPGDEVAALLIKAEPIEQLKPGEPNNDQRPLEANHFLERLEQLGHGQHEDHEGQPLIGCHQEPELIWHPEVSASLDQEDLHLYFQFAASPCIWGGGCNVEEALDILYKARGNIKEAVQQLLKQTKDTQRIWTYSEVQAFERLQVTHGKNFYLISKDLKTKTVKECVQFFYTWKRSTSRNRHLAPMTPNSSGSTASVASSSSSPSPATRATSVSINAPSTTLYSPTASQPNLTGTPSSSVSDESRDSGRGESMLGIDELNNSGKQFQQLISLSSHCQQEAEEEFPCKVCGRVFLKIKSRSAHMKRHKNEAYKR